MSDVSSGAGILLLCLPLGATAARLVLAGVVVWRNIVFPFCSRTPVAEIAGNPLLQEILVPSVFQIRVVAVLDRTVSRYLQKHGNQVPPEYYDDGRLTPGGRIRFLSDRGLIPNGTALRIARQRRNELAHEEAGDIAWNVFEQDAAEVETALKWLGMQQAVEVVREFREMANSLQDSVHGKRYLGAFGTMLAAVAEIYTTHLAIQAARRPKSVTNSVNPGGGHATQPPGRSLRP